MTNLTLVIFKMANTTDLIITCAGEGGVIALLSQKTGINFNLVTDSDECGGQKIVIFESYVARYRSLGMEKIHEIIDEFKALSFSFPELAVLIIDDDDGNFSGVIPRQS